MDNSTRACLIALTLGAALPAPLAAQSAPAQSGSAQTGSSQTGSSQGEVSLTIYNNDLALVQDTRQLTLPKGRTRQEFPDVSAAIRPETVTLSGEGAGIIEQNFDYDLLSPEKLLDKAVGQTVTLVRTNPATGAETREQALVLANNGGTIVRIGDRGARAIWRAHPVFRPAAGLARAAYAFDHTCRRHAGAPPRHIELPLLRLRLESGLCRAVR